MKYDWFIGTGAGVGVGVGVLFQIGEGILVDQNQFEQMFHCRYLAHWKFLQLV